MTDILDARSGVASGRERPLAGRHAIVTGAALGVGAAIAGRFAAAGAKVTVIARDGAQILSRAEQIDPQELAETALWLCLPAAASVTGQAIAIAGGEVM